VLKTARSQAQAAKQTLKDGETYFQKQVKELKWTERRQKLLDMVWKYRKPASAVGLAVLVGVLSFHLRKSQGNNEIFLALLRWANIQRH